MSTPRVISLFKNRRLYDRSTHRYVTYKDLHRLVEENVDFRVLSSRNEADLTHSTMLTLMRARASLELEATRPVLTIGFLSEMIRLRESGDVRLVREFLDHTAAMLTEIDWAAENTDTG